ncbi:Flagellar hook-associated protein 2 (HAP2) (Filament cap protein) (Flagellar cap protein), partial [Durusdinium trenchii]
AVLFTSSSNTVTDVFEGITLNLQSASEEAVTINVSSDRTELEGTIEGFVSAFNETLDRIDFQSRFDEETEARGPLLGDSTLLNLKNAMMSTILGSPLNVSGRYTNLSQVGITVGEGGRLELDKELLQEAIETDPQAVEDLLIKRDIDQSAGTRTLSEGVTVTDPTARETFSSLGVFARIEELSRTYIDSVDGVLTARGRALDNQVRLQEDRIEFFDLRLANKQTQLEREFASLETIISNFQAQQVMSASPAELRLLLLDGAIRFAHQGRQGLIDKNYEQSFEGISQCRAIITELAVGVDRQVDPDLCDRVTSLFMFMFGELTQASMEKDPGRVQSVIELLEFERETWKLAIDRVKQDKTASEE